MLRQRFTPLQGQMGPSCGGENTGKSEFRRKHKYYYCTHTRVSSEFKTRVRNSISGVSTHPTFAHDVHVPSEHGASYRRHDQGFDDHVCRLTMSNQKHTGSLLCVYLASVLRNTARQLRTTTYHYELLLLYCLSVFAFPLCNFRMARLSTGLLLCRAFSLAVNKPDQCLVGVV